MKLSSELRPSTAKDRRELSPRLPCGPGTAVCSCSSLSILFSQYHTIMPFCAIFGPPVGHAGDADSHAHVEVHIEVRAYARNVGVFHER